ncbi:MFS transporter [Curvibacter sp. HBC61]|uniref:MFS transporter n=1 Tax=Curvibacter cyanobacteriorum TaxID=3026422 RepID=A0ABT5MZY0_9BURK|nr:MFS transporter [Curvibacter sp. HBC61]MDD0839402.1 MFS transporter [Curvibacter sp. HBC61]
MNTPHWRWQHGLSYGLLGLPLAFVALPLYVLLPNHYAREFGVPLASLGALLLGARLLDALIDPGLGRLSDRLFQRSVHAVWHSATGASVLLALGMVGLFFPPTLSADGLLVWAGALLMLTYAAYSLLSIAHQSWGARLGGTEVQRSRIVAWREGAGLLGVLLASVLPTLAGLPALLGALALGLWLGGWAWRHAPQPEREALQDDPGASLWQPWQQRGFRHLLGVFMLNGIASAVPATLVLFFVQDRLQASAAQEPLFLGVYFLCAAVSIPLWLRAVGRFGLARSWLGGMLLSVSVFASAATLGAGDSLPFLAVCALSGLALGSDLALPGALLAGLIQQAGVGPAQTGRYVGWWNFATKLNLALAAGLALPLLGLLGYQPGSRSEAGLQALSLAYAVLPCGLKLLAALCLYALIVRPAAAAVPPQSP